MSFRRIVVAFASSRSMAGMTAAIELARSMEAELLGLFVEDIELITLATLPFAEVHFPSATRRAFDVDAMERGLRAQAGRIQQELRVRLAGHAVKWTFEVVRGRIGSALATVVVEDDVVVIPLPAGLARQPGARAEAIHAFRALCAPLLLVQDSLRDDAAIAVVPAPDTPLREIASLVARLAGPYGKSVLFIFFGPQRLRPESWRDRMRELLAGAAVTGRFCEIAGGTRAELERVLAAERPRIVVALAHAPGARDTLLDALPCPLLVLPERETSGRPPPG